MKRKSKLAVKFTVGFLILGILICWVSSVIGYIQYKGEIERQYNEQAYRCAQVAASYVDTDILEEYVKIAESFRVDPSAKDQVEYYRNSETYQETSHKIKVLREKMGANDVFIFTLNFEELDSYQEGKEDNWKPLTYIFDSYTDPKLSYMLGDIGGFNPQYRKELKTIATTGERSDNYFFSEGDYGYNTSAIWPIEKDGKILAMAAVEIPMVTLQESLRQYVIYAILVTIIIIVMVLLGYMIFLYQKVISPINLIADKAERFVDNHNQISEELAEIRSGDEIEYLASSILKMQKDINEYICNLKKVTAEKERIGAELDIANHIQASMLPCIFPAFPERVEFYIFANMTPAKEVGGDFYDFFMIDDRHLAVVMADVSGKGVPAALFMVIGKTLLKDHTQPGRSLGEVFTEVNRLLCDSNSEGLFITAFEGVLDLVTGRFEYVNAGHEAPYICKCGEDYEAYKVRPGFVLAGIDTMCYRSGEMILNEGDKIFLYTDGVPEATNHENELYGSEQLAKVLNENKELDADQLIKKVKEDVDLFANGAPQFDDITMLCLEYRHRMVQKGEAQDGEI